MKLLLAMVAFLGGAGAFEAALLHQWGWFTFLAAITCFGIAGAVSL